MDSGRPGKRGNATHGYKDEQDTSDQQGGTRPRGRPPGSKNKPKDVDKDFEQLSLGKIPPLPPSDPSSKASLPSGQSKKSSSPGKGSLSPGKKLGKQMDQIVPQEAVVIQMLGTFDPPVLLRSPQSLREDGIPIPEAVLTLYNTLRHANTPRKSKEPPQPDEYLSKGLSPWPDDQIVYLKYKGSETSPIEPIELRPVLSKKLMIDESVESSEKSDQENSILLTRYVDWMLALSPNNRELDLIDEAYQYQSHYGRSLNQTIGPVASCPIFLDIEIKKTHTVRDSRIQLAIWETAAIKKRKVHGWSTSFPIPAITVNGHDWTLYIFYELNNGKVVMMGPVKMGSTRDLQEAWRLLRMLWTLVQWGINDYRKDFFEKEILGWAKRVVSGRRSEGSRRHDLGV
ncbi:MAG: hypothetical protein LQ351_008102 [Letrouitia transgressa]|nr:MAG: hypothetical protein LQ351_008102 [Letrouitia transgressa]